MKETLIKHFKEFYYSIRRPVLDDYAVHLVSGKIYKVVHIVHEPMLDTDKKDDTMLREVFCPQQHFVPHINTRKVPREVLEQEYRFYPKNSMEMLRVLYG